MDTLELLTQARAMIADPADWAGGGPIARCEGHCVATAIWLIGGHSRDSLTSSTAGAALADAIGIEDFNPRGSWSEIWNWNDAPERTHAEVMAVYDAAIESISARTA